MPTEKPEGFDLNGAIPPYFDKWVKIDLANLFKLIICVIFLSLQTIERLQKVYERVDDIDLFVGGLAEINPLDGSLPGPTFMCIIAENFMKLKYEDRYFYEAGKGTNPNPFTAGKQ